MRRSVFLAAGATSFAVPFVSVAPATAQSAADIKAFVPITLRTSLVSLTAQFQQSSGRKVTLSYGTIGALATRLQAGEAADVAILAPGQIDDLEKQGKVVAGSRFDLVKVGIGLFVRKGATKPDVATVDALKRSLTAAKTISYVDPKSGAPVGIYLTSMMERLQMTAAMSPKTVLTEPDQAAFDAVLNGRSDLGFQQIATILDQSTVDYVGPLPADVQSYTRYTVAVVAAGTQRDGARAFIELLHSPASLAFMKTRGFEPF
jgi:molybdate transport system substrate-binding protein